MHKNNLGVGNTDVKTYNQSPKEVSETFKNFREECRCFLINPNVCVQNDKICTLNNCTAFKSRYLDFVPICRIPGRQCCTVAFNSKDWKPGDCYKCEIAKKYENPE